MPKKLVLVPNNIGSRGAKLLAQELSDMLGYKVLRVKPDRVRNRQAFYIKKGTPKNVQLDAFTNAGIPCPEHTTGRGVATGWVNDGMAVVCRTLLSASEGRGIHIAESVDQLVDAPLYTKYFKKAKEFRVHVVNGEVIDVQEKRKRAGYEGDRNTKVRNTANGYVFCRDGIVEPESLRRYAVEACRALGYQMGAVDVAYNVKKNELVVLEVNSAPGMVGTTVQKYAQAVIKGIK